MIKLREARLRHIRHYLQVAQQNRTGLFRQEDWENIMQAANYCIELEEWQLLASMTTAINSYLFSSQGPDYIRLNKSLITNDLTEQPYERMDRLSRLEPA